MRVAIVGQRRLPPAGNFYINIPHFKMWKDFIREYPEFAEYKRERYFDQNERFEKLYCVRFDRERREMGAASELDYYAEDHSYGFYEKFDWRPT